MKYLLSFVVLTLISTQAVFAQVNSDTFNVRVFGGADTISPSTPALLSVLPIADTQIDLNWSASTDDYAVSGYSIWRDGSAVATTTLLSYSDTGLVASTTYTYFIYAFDASSNYSSSSNSLATTTLQTPVTPPVSTSTPVLSPQGTVARVVIDDFQIKEGVSTTSIIFSTVYPSRYEIRWGKSVSYELGYIVSGVYSKSHNILLTDLEPGTKYEYQIVGYTPYGSRSVIRTGSFITNNKSLAMSPVNVSRFQAVRNGDDVNLSWQLPTDDKIAYVRVVRSHLGFPEHPQSGAIVYQGLKNAVSDVNILAQYSPVYYTAFVYDIFGNVSSGAVAVVYAITENDQTTDSTGGNIGVVPEIVEEATSTISVERVTVDMKMPQSSEILISQNGFLYSLFDTNITLDSEHNFSISIPSSAIAGNLKSIIVTFIDPTDNKKTYSYLLRINQNQTAYEATIAPPNVLGKSQLTVEIYDYEAFVVATYKTPLTFMNLPKVNEEKVLFPDMLYKKPGLILLSVTLPIVLFLIYLLVVRFRLRTEDNG